MKFLNPPYKLEWDKDKNQQLKKSRGVCFEAVHDLLMQETEVLVMKHHNVKDYPHQWEMYLDINGYTHCIPFVQKGHVIFLKTIFPSRKMNKRLHGAKT